jgi:hypothetical protein
MRTIICGDCEQPKREWYQATNEVWRKANPSIWHEHLCLACLSKGLGRPLRRIDFGERPTDADGNAIRLS